MGQRALLEGIRMDVMCLGKDLPNDQAQLLVERVTDLLDEANAEIERLQDELRDAEKKIRDLQEGDE